MLDEALGLSVELHPPTPGTERLAFAMSFLLGLAAVVAGLAMLRQHAPESTPQRYFEGQSFVRASVASGVEIRPGVYDRDDGPYRWRFTINRFGLREPAEIAPQPAPDTRRVLVLGDSWAFGFGADEGHTLSDWAERDLAARTGGDVEVVNGGVFGACAFDMVRRYQELSASIDFDDLVLLAPRNDTRQQRLLSEREIWLAHRRAPQVPWYLPFERLLLQAGLRLPRQEPPPLPHGDLRASQQDLFFIASDARAAGHDVVLLDTAVDWREIRDAPRRRLRAAVAEIGVASGSARLAQRSCWGFKDLSHPSAAGHQVLGHALAELLATGRSLDSPWAESCDDVSDVGPGKGGWPVPEGG